MNEMSTITDKNEILFWKVFKNIYLLKIILNKIETEEFIEYNDHKKIHANNRIKFKHIISLEWMLDNKQYQLLKYKIKSNDEYIEIDKSGIEKLFKLGKSKQEYKSEQLREIFTLLMKYRKLEMDSVPSLIDEAIQSKSTLALKLLLDDQSQHYQILPSSLELILSTYNANILKLVMGYYGSGDGGSGDKVIICEETKLQSLYLASGYTYTDEFIELVLNQYPQLYTTHPIQPTESQQELLLKIDPALLLCITCPKIQSKLLHSNCINCKIHPTKYQHFSIMFSKEIKESLFKSIERILIYFQLLKLDGSDEIIQLKINNILNQSSVDEPNKLKELYKLLVLNFKSTTILYESYLMIYNELIDEMNDYREHFGMSLKYCVESTSPKVLQSILNSSKELFDWKSFKLYLVDKWPYFQITPSSLSEFIRIFTEGYHQFNTASKRSIENTIVSKIFSTITSNQDYQLVIKSISLKSLLDKLPNTWNPILSDLTDSKNRRSISIKDNETVDWLLKYVSIEDGSLFIYNGSHVSNFNCNLGIRFSFKFEDFKTLSYYYSTNEVNYQHSENYISQIRNLYLDSISKCNIKELEYFKNHFSHDHHIDSITFDDTPRNNPLNFDSLSKEQTLELLKHCSFNEDGKLFFYTISNVFKKFKKDLSSIGTGTIDFNSNVNGTLRLFVYYILEFKLKYVIFILDNFNKINHLSNSFQNIYDQLTHKSIGNYIKTFNILYNSDGDVCTLDINSNKIYKIIQLLVNLKLQINGSGDSCSAGDGSGSGGGISTIESIIQYLYNRFIQTKGITTEQVVSVRKLIQSTTTMEIQHSIYHSFHYINIKSKKLIKYIMGRPYLVQWLLDRGIEYYYDDDKNSINSWELQSDTNSNFNISNYLNYKEFTFEYLFGSGNGRDGDVGASFDEILLKLIDQLSHNPLDKLLPEESSSDDEESINLRNGYLTIKLNADLEYCLDIKRIDLFFSQLEFIKSLIEQGITVGSFPTVFTQTYHKALYAKHKVISSKFVDEFPTHFEFTNQVINKITMVLQVDSLVKLTAYKPIFGLFFFNSLFEVYITQNPIKIDCIDYLFKFCGAPFIASWEKLIQSNVLFLIDHFINNYKNDDLLQVNFKQGKKVLFNYGLLKIKFAKLSEHYCGEFEAAFKFSQNQQVFNNFKQPELQKQVIFDILESKILDTDFTGELIDQEEQDQVSNYFNDHSIEIKEIINKFTSKSMGIMDENDNNEEESFIDSINDTIFTRSFKSGFIKLSCLLLSNSGSRILNPNGNKELFKITNQTITDTIANNNINIIKYYYENTDLITGNNQLLQHLKNELSNHGDYKYLNWLKK